MKSDDTIMDNKNSDVGVKVESSTTIENKEVERGKLPCDSAVKKTTKEEKIRKKDDKSVEQVLKALNSLETTEEKLAALCKKYTDIVDENRKLQLTAKQTEKRLMLVQREKEQLQTEHSKAVLTRSRLESLCRELQRQNKAIKDESLLKIREEEEKRKEVSAKFQTTLNEITALMQQNNEKNSKLREDNLEMTKKFKTVCEQYELREQQVEKISKQMQLEAQLADARLAKAKMEMAAEKEVLLQEKQRLLLDLTEYQTKCRELQTTEVNLRSQISLYTDKYDEFQNALSRSNEVFGGFKGEMEKMSKKICKLEKETSSWKQRWEKSHQALLEMAADKQQRDSELALVTRQLAQLQKLCRTLQAERTSLLAQLKAEGAAKTGGSGRDVPLESLQQSQDNARETSPRSANTPSCRHEAEKDIQHLSTPMEEPKNNNTETDESSSSAELILNDNAQQGDEEPVAVETGNGSVAEEPSRVAEAANEQNSTQGTSLNCMTVQPENVANPEEYKHIVLTNELSENNDSVVLETNKEFVASICATEKQEHVTESHGRLTEDKEASEVVPVATTAVNEGDPQMYDQQYSPDSVVNGRMPEIMIYPLTVTHDQDLSESKNIPVSTTNAATNTNHVSENGVAEQIPVKVAGAENKKGKEGSKKRRNK
ncbi:gamma-taxilin isoform X2 [Zootermopsis nevadensis]|uniref:Alpha-taxilin n=1 Tax=Zootermopsis nevadensis TaxID=136037 RepID=A0A067RHW3_ZOONE|nr:gamma-taxilin isoform X2 [Zootermopsis nevadensis]KDR22608.1 Alpha-taxilin [Zootermopsis nevadensis]